MRAALLIGSSLCLFLIRSPAIANETTISSDSFAIRIDYMLNFPFQLLKKSTDLAEHQFFFSLMLRNRICPRFMYAIPHNVLSGKRSYRNNYSWGIGCEFMLNKKNSKFFFSIGPEFIYQQRFDNFTHSHLSNFSLLTKVTYKLSNRVFIICEPFNLGIGYLKKNYGATPQKIDIYWVAPTLHRLASMGISVRF